MVLQWANKVSRGRTIRGKSSQVWKSPSKYVWKGLMLLAACISKVQLKIWISGLALNFKWTAIMTCVKKYGLFVYLAMILLLERWVFSMNFTVFMTTFLSIYTAKPCRTFMNRGGISPSKYSLELQYRRHKNLFAEGRKNYLQRLDKDKIRPRMLCNGIGVLPHLQMRVTIMGFVEDFCYCLHNS